jgi:hypothetical protein
VAFIFPWKKIGPTEEAVLFPTSASYARLHIRSWLQQQEQEAFLKRINN